MNGDILKDARQGDPFRANAQRHNLVNRVVKDYFKGNLPRSGSPSPFDNDACDVLVQNNTTNTISRYGILGLDAPVIDPNTYQDPALNQGVFLIGAVPTVPDFNNCFGVAQEPIAPGALGRCRLSGVTYAKVSISSTNDACADIADSDVTQLLSGDSGAQILLKPGDIGQQWCVIRLGGGADLPKPQQPRCADARSQLPTDLLAIARPCLSPGPHGPILAGAAIGR
jgi:hypothetical protein